jgi:ribokinase
MQTGIGRKPIVVVGSINADLVAKVNEIPLAGETVLGSDFQIHPGGKGANQAVAVGRLGYPVFMIGKVGSDAFGEQLKAGLSGAGVDIRAVETVETASGVALISVSSRGENCIVVAPGANALVAPADIDANLELIRNAGAVLVQLEIPLETVLHLATVCVRENVPFILDPAPARELPPELLRAVTWFTPNETEAQFYAHGGTRTLEADELKSKLFSLGIRGLVLKLGSRGAFIEAPGEVASFIAPFRVNAMDTTAAGDAFNGAFATGLMLNKSPLESARFASAAAAISVTRAGAQPSLASMDEVETLLNSTDAAWSPAGVGV